MAAENGMKRKKAHCPEKRIMRFIMTQEVLQKLKKSADGRVWTIPNSLPVFFYQI